MRKDAAWFATFPRKSPRTAARNAEGQSLTVSAPCNEWVVQPRGRRSQAAARRQAAALAEWLPPVLLARPRHLAQRLFGSEAPGVPPADLGPDVGQGAQVIMLCGICDGMGTFAVSEPSPGLEDGADDVALVKWLGC